MDDERAELSASLTAAIDFYEWSGGSVARVARMRALLKRAADSRETLAHLLLQRVAELLAGFGVDARARVPAVEGGDSAEEDLTSPEQPRQPLLSLFNQPLPTGLDGRAQVLSGHQLQDRLEQQEQQISRSAIPLGGAVLRDGGSVLRAGQLFRRRAQMRAAEIVLAEALATQPDSPGPLNPEMLAWRTLTSMQELSPAYLTRMVSYVESLVWVEEAEAQLIAGDKPPLKRSRRRKGDQGQGELL